jgi:hypothetical protein
VYVQSSSLLLQPIEGLHLEARYATELTCTFDARDARRAATCPRFVQDVKRQFTEQAQYAGEEPFQYVNTPSCDHTGRNFTDRYAHT